MSNRYSALLRTGSVSGNLVETLTISLLEMLGTAFTKDVNSFVYAEIQADAFLLADAIETIEKMVNQFDPNETTDFLSRWEALLGIHPNFRATENERREAIVRRSNSKAVIPHLSGIADYARQLLPDLFEEVRYETSHDAIVFATDDDANSSHVNVGISSISDFGLTGGIHAPFNPDRPDWNSNISHIVFKLHKPDYMTEAEFLRKASVIREIEDVLPSWTTYGYVTDNKFLLDTDKMLDRAALTDWIDIFKDGYSIETQLSLYTKHNVQYSNRTHTLAYKFRYVAIDNADVEISVTFSGDCRISVFEGNNANTALNLVDEESATATFPSTNGTTYWIYIAGLNEGDAGPVTVTLSDA